MTETTTPTTRGDPPDSVWRNRNFRRFFAGQFVTNAGDSLYSVAILWLVFELSGSTVLTGVANAMLLAPFLLQIVAGPFVDRLPLRRVMVGSQVVQGVVVLVLPAAAVAGVLTVPLVLVVIPVLALTTLLMAPVQTTLVPRIVSEDNLSQGNSALATVTLGLDMVFDALGGLLVALFGTTALFLLDSVTFAVAATLFASIAIPRVDPDDGRDTDDGGLSEALGTYLADVREGIEILRGSLFVPILAASAVVNFAVGVTLAILPAYGELLGGPALYGFMLGALGIGRMIGSTVASRLDGLPYGRLLLGGSLVSTLLWVGAVALPTAAGTVGLFGVAWIWPGINGVLTATLNQRIFPADRLGRVSATKGTAATATLPIGSLAGGLIAEWLGTATTMGLAGLGFAVAAGALVLLPSIRRLPAVRHATSADFGLSFDP